MLTVLATASCLYATFLSPWWIRNATLFHSFVPFATGSTVNLYIGNNRNNPNAGIDLTDNVEPAVVANIAALPDEIARQRAYGKAALDYIRKDPDHVSARGCQKIRSLLEIIVPNAAEFKSGLYSLISALSFGPGAACWP